MSNSNPQKAILVCGARISENLVHHKSSDVLRILEDKGFVPSDKKPTTVAGQKSLQDAMAFEVENVQYFAQKDGSDDGNRTVILFGADDFVLPENGVRFYTL